MKEVGKITRVDDKYGYVLIKRHSACGKCKACELGSGDRKEIEIKAVNKIGAKEGDNVSVELESPDVLKAAFIVYMIPLIFFGLGWLISYLIGIKDELINLGIGMIFMGVAFFVVKKIDGKLASTKKYDPIIIEVAHESILEN